MTPELIELYVSEDQNIITIAEIDYGAYHNNKRTVEIVSDCDSCDLYGKRICHLVPCHADQRNDKLSIYFKESTK